MDERENAALTRLLFDIDRLHDHMERQDALAWLVVCVDHDSIQRGDPNCVVGTYGPFSSPEEALVEAGKHDANSLERDEGDPGWSHLIRPLYPPVTWKDGS